MKRGFFRDSCYTTIFYTTIVTLLRRPHIANRGIAGIKCDRSGQTILNGYTIAVSATRTVDTHAVVGSR